MEMNRVQANEANEMGQANLNGARTVEGQWAWQAKWQAGKTQPAEQQLQATPPAE